jgi:hypothetical protein
MYDKWEDKGIEAECEEDESVNLQLYSDHRRGDLDSYPVIAVCENCAAETIQACRYFSSQPTTYGGRA